MPIPTVSASPWRRFFKYGVVGWLLEVVMTGASSVLARDTAATARTFLWMLPIYGTGGLLLERVRARVRDWPRGARAGAYLPVIYGVEFVSGLILREVLGHCPWDYRRHVRDPSRLVQPSYAPLWYAVALLFEPVHDWAAEPAYPALVVRSEVSALSTPASDADDDVSAAAS
jgi:uncharacterized membrane protein